MNMMQVFPTDITLEICRFARFEPVHFRKDDEYVVEYKPTRTGAVMHPMICKKPTLIDMVVLTNNLLHYPMRWKRLEARCFLIFRVVRRTPRGYQMLPSRTETFYPETNQLLVEYFDFSSRMRDPCQFKILPKKMDDHYQKWEPTTMLCDEHSFYSSTEEKVITRNYGQYRREPRVL